MHSQVQNLFEDGLLAVGQNGSIRAITDPEEQQYQRDSFTAESK